MAKQTKNKLTLSECRRKFVKEYSELLKHHWRVFLCYTPLTGLFAIIAVAILVNGIRYVKWGEIIVSVAMLSACAVAWGAHFAVMMSRIKKNMNTCPPIFSRSMEMLRKKAEKYEAYSDIDWSKYDADGK